MVDKNVLLGNAADRMRIWSIRATNASNSGHPTSCGSMAEIMSVLFLDVMRYRVEDPRDPNNDRFVLSKGHAAPVLYAAWAEAGGLQSPEKELLQLRKISSDLEGHPTPRLSFVDVATGSLGQGLSCAAGMAYTGKYIEKGPYRVYCVLGDGEMAEGSVWEALSFSGIYQLDNLVAIFDINRLGQSQPTAFQHNMDLYKKRVESFGWHAIVVDGQNIASLLDAFNEAAKTSGKPTAILAQTYKGAGFDKISNEENWHGKPLGDKAAHVIEILEQKIKSSSVHGAGDCVLKPMPPQNILHSVDPTPIKMLEKPSYKIGQMVATRAAYGTALVKLGDASKRVIALDADTKNSTFSIKFLEKYPERFIECFIAEQNMIGVAIGCGTRSRTIPFVNTFAAFLTRGFDQIRMGAVSQTDCNFAGSHVGVSIGEDGPSQMALEDLALFRSIPGSTVFYPTDAVSTEKAVELAANTKGICFIRTGRPNTAVIYDNDEHFEIGKAKIVRASDSDQVTVVSAGVTLYEALKAADVLRDKGVHIRVVDLFTVKPIDKALLEKCAHETGGRVLTVEDHYPEGGLGEAVASALSETRGVVLKKLAVNGVPRSGQPEELLAMFAIDAASICETVSHLLQ